VDPTTALIRGATRAPWFRLQGAPKCIPARPQRVHAREARPHDAAPAPLVVAAQAGAFEQRRGTAVAAGILLQRAQAQVLPEVGEVERRIAAADAFEVDQVRLVAGDEDLLVVQVAVHEAARRVRGRRDGIDGVRQRGEHGAQRCGLAQHRAGGLARAGEVVARRARHRGHGPQRRERRVDEVPWHGGAGGNDVAQRPAGGGGGGVGAELGDQRARPRERERRRRVGEALERRRCARPGLLVEELHEHRGRAARQAHDRASARAPGDQLRRGRTAEPRLERAAQPDRIAEQPRGGQPRVGARDQLDDVVAVQHERARRRADGPQDRDRAVALRAQDHLGGGRQRRQPFLQAHEVRGRVRRHRPASAAASAAAAKSAAHAAGQSARRLRNGAVTMRSSAHAFHHARSRSDGASAARA
jgi:hypothetical protein